MKGKTLKIGWALFAVWLLGIGTIANSYRSTQATIDQVYELGSSIQQLRDSFSFDSPYQVHMADSQSLNLQLIYALRLQLDAHYQDTWFLPDINHLLYTTDRFIEQSQLYLRNQLDMQGLVENIDLMRERYQGENAESFYLQLSANVLEAMFGDSTSSPKVYRDIDAIYSQSEQLSDKQRQDLQQALAKVSTVLGGYAQGRYTVEKLQTHDVHEQINILRDEFESLLTHHILVSLATTLAVFVGFLALLRYNELRFASGEPKEQRHEKQVSKSLSKVQGFVGSSTKTPPADPSAKQVSAKDSNEVNVDFKEMAESLNNDMESVSMLLELFVEDHTTDADQIRKLLANEPEEARRKAHSLKGVGGNIGATKLREAASKVEEAIKESNKVDAPVLDELEMRLNEAISAAHAFLQQQRAIKNV